MDKNVDTIGTRERKSRVLNFRIPPSVEAKLTDFVNPQAGVNSLDKAARQLLTETLAEHHHQRKMETFCVDKMAAWEIFTGDAEAVLSKLPARICQACLTSPPYWRQRRYGHPDEVGQERTVDNYISRLANAFDQVHRILTDDGVLWCVIDDSYWKKQLMGVPWRLAFELQRRGWHWRSEIVWSKASTPEAAKDRPTRAHETVLLFSKKATYYYDYEAILEPHTNPWTIDCIKKAQETGQTERPRSNPFSKEARRENGTKGITRAEYGALMNPNGKNARDVWVIPSEKYPGSHSAVMPLRLGERCVLASTKTGDVVLDPFAGMATTGVAALRHGRRFLGIEIAAEYVEAASKRLADARANTALHESASGSSGNGHEEHPKSDTVSI